MSMLASRTQDFADSGLFLLLESMQPGLMRARCIDEILRRRFSVPLSGTNTKEVSNIKYSVYLTQ